MSTIARRSLMKLGAIVGIAPIAASSPADTSQALPKNFAVFDGHLIDLSDTHHRVGGLFLCVKSNKHHQEPDVGICQIEPATGWPESAAAGRDGWVKMSDHEARHVTILGRVVGRA